MITNRQAARASPNHQGQDVCVQRGGAVAGNWSAATLRCMCVQAVLWRENAEQCPISAGGRALA